MNHYKDRIQWKVSEGLFRKWPYEITISVQSGAPYDPYKWRYNLYQYLSTVVISPLLELMPPRL